MNTEEKIDCPERIIPLTILSSDRFVNPPKKIVTIIDPQRELIRDKSIISQNAWLGVSNSLFFTISIVVRAFRIFTMAKG